MVITGKTSLELTGRCWTLSYINGSISLTNLLTILQGSTFV